MIQTHPLPTVLLLSSDDVIFCLPEVNRTVTIKFRVKIRKNQKQTKVKRQVHLKDNCHVPNSPSIAALWESDSEIITKLHDGSGELANSLKPFLISKIDFMLKRYQADPSSEKRTESLTMMKQICLSDNRKNIIFSVIHPKYRNTSGMYSGNIFLRKLQEYLTQSIW